MRPDDLHCELDLYGEFNLHGEFGLYGEFNKLDLHDTMQRDLHGNYLDDLMHQEVRKQIESDELYLSIHYECDLNGHPIERFSVFERHPKCDRKRHPAHNQIECVKHFNITHLVGDD